MSPDYNRFVILIVLLFFIAGCASKKSVNLSIESTTTSEQQAFNLTELQRKELIVFGIKAIGMHDKDVKDVAGLSTIEEVLKVVSAGINMNGLLCAKILRIIPLKIQRCYEVECITYRGGTSTATYIIDTRNGTAFVP